LIDLVEIQTILKSIIEASSVMAQSALGSFTFTY